MHFPLPWQLVLVLVVVLLLFGASRLPELGRSLGLGVKNFKKGLSGEEDTLKLNKKEEE